MENINKRKLHNWLVGIWFLIEVFIETLKFEEYFGLVSATAGLSLLVFCIYFLLKKCDENRIKTYDEVTSETNAGNYLQLLLLLKFNNIDDYLHFGIWIKVGLYLTALISIIIVLSKEWISRKVLNSGGVFFAHLVLGIFIYFSAEDSYIEHFGNEVIGSYWSKPDFRAKYIVKVSEPENLQEIQTLQAIVHVFSISYERESQNVRGEEYYQTYDDDLIILDTIVLYNGEYLTFDDCELEINKTESCLDQNMKLWHIKMTDEKVD